MNGLRNIGNTCYLNSGLQMLLNNENLMKNIMNLDDKDEFIIMLKKFVYQYHTNENQVLIPKFIKNKVSKSNLNFMGYGQQDSEEFITSFLSILNDYSKENSIDKVFNNSIKTTIKCKLIKCLNKSYNKEKSIKLIFEIDDNCFELDDCYRKFKVSERLDKDNMVYCEKCKRKTIVSRKAEVEEWSDDLIIVLKRFNFNGRRLRKNNNKIVVPTNWRKGYSLKGFVYHSGSLNGGHYIYIGKYKERWYIYDDNSVNEITNEDHFNKLKDNAYIYYFKK